MTCLLMNCILSTNHTGKFLGGCQKLHCPQFEMGEKEDQMISLIGNFLREILLQVLHVCCNFV